MKIYKLISSPLDSTALQADLNDFTIWCLKNHLELNVNKCQSITFSRKRVRVPTRDYYLNGHLVPRVSTIRDLGILCDSDLNFHSHFDNIVSRANSMLGFVKRWAKEFLDPYVTRALYMTFVRPILEYASQVWSPYQQVHIQRVEAVQRRFVRFALRGLPWVDAYNLPPYVDRLKLIDLQSLQRRREIADIIFVHQVTTGIIESPSILDRMNLNINVRSLRSVELFKVQFHRTDYGKNEPITRMLRAVNDSAAIFDFNFSKLQLKRRLKNQS